MDQYQISNIPSRYQLTQHYQSSLDQPNLQNIQAKLYAIRQKNYEMAQNFFKQKYGSSSAYDQYLQKSNMVDLKPVNIYQGQNQIDLKKHLQHKARQIQIQQLQKINLAKGSQSNKKNNRKSSKINPWLQSNKKNNVKQSRNKNNRADNDSSIYNDDDYLEQQHQYIDLKQNNHKKGQYISEFKQYLLNKNKYKHQNQNNHLNENNSINNKNESPLKNLNNSSITKSKLISTAGNNFMQNKSHLSNQEINNSSQKINLSPEEQLVKKIFKTVKKMSNNNSKGPQQYIQKIQLAQYLTQNDRILNILGIKASQIIQKIHKQLQTKDSNKVKYHQCLLFFYKLLGKQQQHKKLKALHSFSNVPSGCILQPQVIKLFQKIFKSLDKHYDLIVKRLQFIQKLALDPTLNKIINTPAVYEKNLQKSVSLRRIFQRIQVQILLNQNNKAQEYISWEQFIKYFQSGHTDRAKYDIIRLAEGLKDQQKMGLTDIPDSVFQIICRVITKVDKGNQYFSTLDLIGQILLDKLYEAQKYNFVRGKGNDLKSGNIPMQTFQQVLKRIKQKAPKYISIKQFLQFFSVKGQPIQLIQQKLQKQIRNANDPAKITKNQDKLFQKNQVDGYDSDPQFYNKSQMIGKKQFRKTIGDKQLVQFYMNDSRNNEGSSIDVQNCKITVPQPFKFQQRQKQRALQKLSKGEMNRSSSLDNRSNYKFKAKQIPKKVRQTGLFQKILEENEKRIQQRRKCSMLLTLANQQPFSFYNRKTKKKTIQQRNQYQFKANPIPWYCSVNLLQKKQQKQINRNQKIARMAQQSLNKAKLPPRMQKDYQQKIAQKKLQSNKKQIKTQHQIKCKQPPNFQVLHKQFQSALQRKRKQNKTTQVKQFHFSQPKRQTKPRLTEQIEQINQKNQNKQQKWRQTLKSSINVLASSTAKFDQQVLKRRKQIQEKKRKEEQKEKQLNQKKKVDQQLKNKLKSQTFKGTQKKLQQISSLKKQQMKKQDQNFKQMKAQWLVNAKKQPLLIQRPLKRDQRIQKMKKLQQISQNLKKNGIKGKEHDAYFNRQQLLMIQDYQLLKKAEKL